MLHFKRFRFPWSENEYCPLMFVSVYLFPWNLLSISVPSFSWPLLLLIFVRPVSSSDFVRPVSSDFVPPSVSSSDFVRVSSDFVLF